MLSKTWVQLPLPPLIKNKQIMYRLFWIDRERENQVKLFEDDRFSNLFTNEEKAWRFLMKNKGILPACEYVILPYFKID
jgi:hypothetical protein